MVCTENHGMESWLLRLEKVSSSTKRRRRSTSWFEMRLVCNCPLSNWHKIFPIYQVGTIIFFEIYRIWRLESVLIVPDFPSIFFNKTMDCQEIGSAYHNHKTLQVVTWLHRLQLWLWGYSWLDPRSKFFLDLHVVKTWMDGWKNVVIFSAPNWDRICGVFQDGRDGWGKNQRCNCCLEGTALCCIHLKMQTTHT